jgi:hypothetical protein
MTGDCPRHECRVGSDEAFLMRASDNGWQIRPARPYGQQRLPAGRRRSGLEARFDALISPQGGLAVLAADRFAAQEAGLFRALRESNGLSATPSDMLIAGIVASSGGTMATRNTSDFTHLPITVVNPWQPP